MKLVLLWALKTIAEVVSWNSTYLTEIQSPRTINQSDIDGTL